MSRPRESIWQSLAVVFVTLGLIVAFIVWAILAGPATQIVIVRFVVITLVIFLTILFLRYFALLWFAYLGHAERNMLGMRELRELPPVSILVPAYNEGLVLERALTSLMQVEYPEYEVLVVDDGSEATLIGTFPWEGLLTSYGQQRGFDRDGSAASRSTAQCRLLTRAHYQAKRLSRDFVSEAARAEIS